MTKYVVIHRDKIIEKHEFTVGNLKDSLNRCNTIMDYLYQPNQVYDILIEFGVSSDEDITFMLLPDVGTHLGQRYMMHFKKHNAVIHETMREDKISKLLD